MNIEKNRICTVNGKHDLFMYRDARIFIGAPCIIEKVTKAGLVQVKLASNHTKLVSIPKENITLVENVPPRKCGYCKQWKFQNQFNEKRGVILLKTLNGIIELTCAVCLDCQKNEHRNPDHCA